MKLPFRILIVDISSFGDALITLDWIKWLAMVRDTNQIEIDLLTRHEFLPLFKGRPEINRILLWHKRKKVGFFRKWQRTLRQIVRIQRNQYDLVLKCPREQQIQNPVLFILLSIVKGGLIIRHEEPCPDLIFNHYIYTFFSLFLRSILIPRTIVNVYSIQKHIVEHIFNKPLPTAFVPTSVSKRTQIAIHPSASMPCKLWPMRNWVRLIHELDPGEPILVFCAPGELPEIQENFASVKDKIMFVAQDLPQFLTRLEEVRILVCLDSFAAHAAFYKHVPYIIMLNGANDARYFVPPRSIVLDNQSTCIYHPCHNYPKCENTDFQYACIASITVENVYKAILSTLIESPLELP